MTLGNRGEGWVILQFLIFGLLIFTARFHIFDMPVWLRYSGGLFLAVGGYLGTSGVINLGRNLIPFPRPRESGYLVTHGIYNYVRHPIYSGIIFGTIGWSLIISNVVGLFIAVGLFIFFDAKSRHEERWLLGKYEGYIDYRDRVKKLIPWIY